MGVGGLCEHFDYVYSKKLSLQTLQEEGEGVWGNGESVSLCFIDISDKDSQESIQLFHAISCSCVCLISHQYTFSLVA